MVIVAWANGEVTVLQNAKTHGIEYTFFCIEKYWPPTLPQWKAASMYQLEQMY